MAVYNGGDYLDDAIKSVLSQTYNNYELIIIDGNSKDNSVDVIKKYQQHIAYWKSEPDKGIYDAWNKACLQAKGEWFCFIGADDFFWDADAMNKIVPTLSQHLAEKHRFVYGKIAQVTRNSRQIIEYLGEDWAKLQQRFSMRMTLAHCGAFHHRSLFDELGYFDATFKIAGDYEFLLREYVRNPDFAYYLPELLIGMRTGGVSGDLQQRKVMANETALARKKNKITRFSLDIFLWKIRINIYLMLKSIIGEKASVYLADSYRAFSGKEKRWSK